MTVGRSGKLDLVDTSRGPTASQAAGLTFAAARAIIFAGGLPLERNGVLVGALGVSSGDSAQDARAAGAASAAFSAGTD